MEALIEDLSSLTKEQLEDLALQIKNVWVYYPKKE